MWAVLSYRAHSVKIHGTKYKSGAVIRIKSQSDVSQFEYARIDEIYVIKLWLLVLYRLYHTFEPSK